MAEAGGGGGKVDAFVQLGDKIHKNVNSSIEIIGNLKNNKELRKLKARELALEKDKWGIQRILEQQKNAQAMQQTTWKRGFMQAMAKRGQNQGSIGRV